MSKQESEADIIFRTETETLTICSKGDIIDVDSIQPEFSTNVEAVSTASGVAYIKDPSNLSGTFEISTWKRYASHELACTDWANATATFLESPKKGTLEISMGGKTFKFPAGIETCSPGIIDYFELSTTWSFILAGNAEIS